MCAEVKFQLTYLNLLNVIFYTVPYKTTYILFPRGTDVSLSHSGMYAFWGQRIKGSQSFTSRAINVISPQWCIWGEPESPGATYCNIAVQIRIHLKWLFNNKKMPIMYTLRSTSCMYNLFRPKIVTKKVMSLPRRAASTEWHKMKKASLRFTLKLQLGRG